MKNKSLYEPKYLRRLSIMIEKEIADKQRDKGFLKRVKKVFNLEE